MTRFYNQLRSFYHTPVYLPLNAVPDNITDVLLFCDGW